MRDPLSHTEQRNDYTFFYFARKGKSPDSLMDEGTQLKTTTTTKVAKKKERKDLPSM